MKIMLWFFMILLSSYLVSADCDEGQIDINEASAEELDQLTGIGPVKAQAIIDTRPFDSVDELIDVNGIGEITLNSIKEQGLACVSGDNEEEKESEEEQNETAEIVMNLTTNSQPNSLNSAEEKEGYNKNPEPIILNPKDIKTENNVGFSKENYPIYGLIIFCILLAVLFLIKNKQEKDEFRKRK